MEPVSTFDAVLFSRILSYPLVTWGVPKKKVVYGDLLEKHSIFSLETYHTVLGPRICDNYSIIAYYFQRPMMNERFASRATKFNDDGIPESLYKMHSHLGEGYRTAKRC